MKLAELFETEEKIDIDATKGAGYKGNNKRDKNKLTTYLLRRKAEKSNPKYGDDTKPDNTTTTTDVGDDPDEKRYGAGLQ